MPHFGKEIIILTCCLLGTESAGQRQLFLSGWMQDLHSKSFLIVTLETWVTNVYCFCNKKGQDSNMASIANIGLFFNQRRQDGFLGMGRN